MRHERGQRRGPEKHTLMHTETTTFSPQKFGRSRITIVLLNQGSLHVGNQWHRICSLSQCLDFTSQRRETCLKNRQSNALKKPSARAKRPVASRRVRARGNASYSGRQARRTIHEAGDCHRSFESSARWSRTAAAGKGEDVRKDSP